MAWSKDSTPASRGYDHKWRKLREVILKRDGYVCTCDECRTLARVLPANHVDHILPKAQGGTDAPNNLRSLNGDCHKRITIEQKGQSQRMGCDVNGWPLDPSHTWNRPKD